MNKKMLKFAPQFVLASLLMSGCTPTIQLETPKEGITINMNVVVDHKIQVDMDDKAKKVLKK